MPLRALANKSLVCVSGISLVFDFGQSMNRQSGGHKALRQTLALETAGHKETIMSEARQAGNGIGAKARGLLGSLRACPYPVDGLFSRIMEENSGLPPSAPPPANAPPPAAAPPPPIISPPSRPAPAPPPAPPRRGRGWMVFSIVLLVLLTLSVVWNVASLIGSLGLGESARYTHSYGPRIEEAVVSREAHSVDKIAVVPVNGVIVGQAAEEGAFVSAELIKAELRRAAEDDDVKAVILKVDSPGGEVLASDEIYRAIADFQKKRNGKPVVASMGGLAASGGYYVSSPCRWIVAHDLTITGSIGVIMHSWNYRGLMDKVGVRPEVYKSGRFKDMMSGEREPTRPRPRNGKCSRHLSMRPSEGSRPWWPRDATGPGKKTGAPGPP